MKPDGLSVNTSNCSDPFDSCPSVHVIDTANTTSMARIKPAIWNQQELSSTGNVYITFTKEVMF